jgi:hypothetical protein
MNRQDTKELLEQLFREYGTGSDGAVREGSVITDQVINPLAMILEPIFRQADEVVRQNNPPGEGASEDLLDQIGERLLVSRKNGRTPTADIRLLLESPAQIRLPAGSSALAGDLEFQTTRSVRFTEDHFTEVTREGEVLYESPDVPVEAVEIDPQYEVGTSEINVPSFTVPGLVGIYNPAPSTSGQSPEGDEAFRERIQQSISSRAMDTEDGLRFQVGEEFGGEIRNLSVAGPTSPHITRNVVESYEDVQDVGYQNKTQGQGQPNNSFLYYRTTRNKTAGPTAYDQEVRQESYNSVTSPDLSLLSVSTDVLFEDNFNRPQSFQTAIGNQWIAGNTGERWQTKDASSGLYVNGGRLIMGPRNLRQTDDPFLEAPGEPFQTLPVLTLSATQADRERARTVNQLLQEEGLSSEVRRQVIEEITRAREYPSDGYRGVENNTSPVVQREIAQPHGFRVKGTLRTSDEEHPICVSMARVSNPEELSTVGRGDPKFRWYEGYGFVLQQGGGGAPNLFITDNASAARQMTVVGEEYVGGNLDFNALTQTTVPFDTNTTYRYEMEVGTPAQDENAIPLTVRLWEDGGGRPTTPTLQYGAYVPENRREQLLVPSETDITSPSDNPLQSTQVGVGVSATGGTEYWALDEFQVQNIQQSYAQVISEIDVSGISDSVELTISARGKGFNQSGAEDYGHDIYVWNAADEGWEDATLRSPRYSDFSIWTSQFQVDLTDRVTAGGHLRLLITSAYPHEGPAVSPTAAELDVDLIEGRRHQGQVSLGGMADVFLTQTGGSDQRPSTEASTSIASASAVNALSPSDFGGPVSEIVSVTSGQVQLEEGSDYRYFWAADGRRGSMNETLYLAVAGGLVGTSIDVTARVHNQVPSIHDFVMNSPKRKVDANLLVRHRQPVRVNLTAEATGSFSTSPDQIIREWVRGRLEDYIDLSALASVLRDRGAETVDVQNATLQAARIDDNGNETIVESSTLERDQTETFVPGDITVTVIS